MNNSSKSILKIRLRRKNEVKIFKINVPSVYAVLLISVHWKRDFFYSIRGPKN